MPKVSVIMPAYNAEKTVSQAINSVIGQTFGDFELIVIDDCSKDGTADIIENLAREDARIIFLKNEQNSGVSKTRNYGVSVARGELIAFLDSDDMWREDKLEKQLEIFEKNTEAVISYTASSFIDSEGNPYSYVMQAEEKTDYKTLLRKNLLSCSSVMIRTEVMKGIKMPNDRMHEDYYVWLTVLKKTAFAYGVNEPLLIYRLSTNSKSSNRIKSAKMLFNTYTAVGYDPLRAAFLVLRYTVHSVTKRYNISSGQSESKTGSPSCMISKRP